MRDSDITNLKFENINWERSEISFFQKKTNGFLALPLPPVVGEAIIDYLRYGRPQTDSKYVFVKNRPPFQQTAPFYLVMRTVLERQETMCTRATARTTPVPMLMYGKEASNRKQEIDRQHHTIPNQSNQRPKDKHYGNVHNRLWNHG